MLLSVGSQHCQEGAIESFYETISLRMVTILEVVRLSNLCNHTAVGEELRPRMSTLRKVKNSLDYRIQRLSHLSSYWWSLPGFQNCPYVSSSALANSYNSREYMEVISSTCKIWDMKKAQKRLPKGERKKSILLGLVKAAQGLENLWSDNTALTEVKVEDSVSCTFWHLCYRQGR